MQNRIDILELRRDELADWMVEHNLETYRANQIFKWVYLRLVDEFDQMTDLSKSLREFLPEHFVIGCPPIGTVETSPDGTRKYRFQLKDGKFVESVLIPERDHHTLCVSSQVGCALGCRFCLTGSGGFTRNLTRGEIVAQIREVRKHLGSQGNLTNLVFMGMGEPLANYGNLVSALGTISDSDYGLKFSSHRITVSTAGLVPRMADLGEDTRVNLAISLNATDNATRDRLMPLNRKFPIETLLEACRNYPLPKGKRITFEYIVIKDVNDSDEDAHRLAKLLRLIRSKINLIPYNPYPGCEFQRPEESDVLRFQKILIDHHFTTMIRKSKGRDISAACGQLVGERNE
ncbi:23S rRNA (adenine(2503)-C(2))-methyltransferase @ tRNA (adenine(37)-C(2))-methyltransferase (EC [Olavius algarvensis associated proteobacterium Delta 3]|nr:23S rRNA (adenine(2503)-C(2))-methyltransferase @ tRNA (adenine(37)-C(2))-methyltransferase (EC [Olavius algarvensis associated proteobacterium Delta 3]